MVVDETLNVLLRLPLTHAWSAIAHVVAHAPCARRYRWVRVQRSVLRVPVKMTQGKVKSWEFIVDFRTYQLLWKRKHIDYTNKTNRNDDAVISSGRKHNLVKTVKNKTKSSRSCFSMMILWYNWIRRTGVDISMRLMAINIVYIWCETNWNLNTQDERDSTLGWT